MREYNYGKGYDSFKNTFPVDGVRSYLNLPPITIDDIPCPPKYTNILLIHFHLPFLLPLETMLLCWPPLLITHNFLSFILMILKTNIPPWLATLSISVREKDTDPVSMMWWYATKHWGSIALCVHLTKGCINIMDLS